MSLLAIGLAFAAASVILFGISFVLMTRLGRKPVDSEPSGDDDEVAGLDRPWPI